MRSGKILSCALLLTLCLLFTACSGKEEYQDSLSCRELTDLAQKKVAVAGGYTAYDENVLEYFFKGTDLPDDFSLIYSTTSADINEIGIFHAPNADDAKELCTICEDYLTEMQETQSAFIASYAPEELNKLKNATVVRYGNYVIYTILTPADGEEVLSLLRDRLKRT